MPDIRLIDANAVLKEMKEMYCKRCSNCNGVWCRACEHRDDMDFIEDAPTIDAQPVKRGEMSEWIRCSERMPEANEDVLVVINPGDYQSIHIGYMYNEGDWMIDGEFWYEEGDPSITHWMPLPEPPKEVDENEQAQ